MKLIAEQVKSLRKKKQELLQKREEYLKYFKSLEKTDMENIGHGFCIDSQVEANLHKNYVEYDEIVNTLKESEFVTKRNFNAIDIGTRFTIKFDEDDIETGLLTEKIAFVNPNREFVSLDSDLGKALLGKKEGETVSYIVSATGRRLSVTIDEIDKIKEHYEHFINEVPYSRRGSSKLKDQCFGDERVVITSSQKEIMEEELGKYSYVKHNSTATYKKNNLEKILKKAVVKIPDGDTIGIGSKVKVLLQDKNGSYEREFEMIQRAYSTEIESQYVERISSFGNALYGLRKGESFQFKRGNQIYSGIVLSVENENEKKRVK